MTGSKCLSRSDTSGGYCDALPLLFATRPEETLLTARFCACATIRRIGEVVTRESIWQRWCLGPGGDIRYTESFPRRAGRSRAVLWRCHISKNLRRLPPEPQSRRVGRSSFGYPGITPRAAGAVLA